LVVDDHPANREVLNGLLQEVGFEVDTALSGEEALSQCAQQLPALVMMDLRMEGLSGLETTALLREEYGESIHIVAVSASAYDTDRQACLAAGCDEFLAKPVRVSELWQTLGRLLNLTWIQGSDEPSRATDLSFTGATQAPSPEILRALHELAKAGDIVGLRARAQTLAMEQPENADFARRVLELADSFKLKAIRQLISTSLTEPRTP
jgi:CheY-like chemotaxis protein